MEKAIHKFLDGYFQDEFVIKKLEYEDWSRVFYNNEKVLTYRLVGGVIKVIVPDLDLIRLISSFFSIENEVSLIHVQRWFLLKKDFLINGKDN
jgi:hypothetical protein